jgi:S1-C subfamily serine protease
LAFQHDSPVSAAQCGSPLVDLDGQIVGINIARAGRVSTLALPMATILPAIERLKSGELAPAVVNAPRLAEIERQLAECQTELETLPAIMSAAESLRTRTAIQREELERMMAELQKRLDEVNETDKQETEKLNSAQTKKRDLERKRERLESEKQQLSHGVND